MPVPTRLLQVLLLGASLVIENAALGADRPKEGKPRLLVLTDIGGDPDDQSAQDLIYLLNGLGIDTGVTLDAVVAASRLIAPHLGHALPSRYLQAAR